jgi:hypothetical protein
VTRLFISYRRDDGAGVAGRLRDRLVPVYGAANVFVDVDNLQVGDRFDRRLEEALKSADVLIPVIGRRWVEILGERGQSHRTDYVRWEIATALQSGIAVVPVTVEGAQLPDLAVLPEDLRTLPLNNGYAISHRHFDRDVADFISQLREKWPPLKPSVPAVPNAPTSRFLVPLFGVLALVPIFVGWQLVRGPVSQPAPPTVDRPSLTTKTAAPQDSVRADTPPNTAQPRNAPLQAPATTSPPAPQASLKDPARKPYDRARDGLMRIAVSADDQMMLNMARLLVRDMLGASGATYESATPSATHRLRLEIRDSQDVAAECGGLRYWRSVPYALVDLATEQPIATGSVNGEACYNTGKSGEELAQLAARAAMSKLATELNAKLRVPK